MQLEINCYRPEGGWDAPLRAEFDAASTMVLVFGGPALHVDSDPISDLLTSFPRSAMIGCSTAGEIVGDELVTDGVVVAVAKFESSDVRSVSAQITADGSYDAGDRLGSQLNAPDLRAVVVVSEGLDVNGSELVRGLVAALPPGTLITGGLAADGDRFNQTWVLAEGELRQGCAAAVGLYGPDVQVGWGSGGGWDMFGPERVITRSSGNVLFELDGRPALDLYQEYLGEKAEGLPASGLLFPLAVRREATAEEFLVRTILGIDEADRSLTFAGDVPTGSKAQLMTASFDRLVEGAEAAALMASPETPDPLLALAVSCVGRRLALGEHCEDEIEATLAVFPNGTKQVGYYSYGEISPAGLQPCELHNQTMTLTTIGERVPS